MKGLRPLLHRLATLMLFSDCKSTFLRDCVWGGLALAGGLGVIVEARAEVLLEYPPKAKPTAVQPLAAERAVVRATFDQESAATPSLPLPANPRLLTPKPAPPRVVSSREPPRVPRKTTSFGLPQIESLTTAGTGLAIVVGLFLVCMAMVRRSGPKPTSLLPAEAVAVLGRLPLANRNFAQLIRIGNKLVLVAVTPDGITPLTEVADPQEVDRLLGICHGTHKQSTTAEFQQVLQQLSKEPAEGFLGSEAGPTYPKAKQR